MIEVVVIMRAVVRMDKGRRFPFLFLMNCYVVFDCIYDLPCPAWDWADFIVNTLHEYHTDY